MFVTYYGPVSIFGTEDTQGNKKDNLAMSANPILNRNWHVKGKQ